ncbi:MAG TPA: hypothetical protein VMW20_04095 [Candidatus Nanoarchaeia archaeon]|nr:hypothetical protein [Candidatus Nanoarchaeia archaeon]
MSRDYKKTPILEFYGDDAEFGSMLAVLAGKEEIVIRTQMNADINFVKVNTIPENVTIHSFQDIQSNHRDQNAVMNP